MRDYEGISGHAPPTVAARSPGRGRTWLRILLVGLVLWTASLIVILVTANANLVPTLILLGSFLTPVTFVVWAFENWRVEEVTGELVVIAFVVGGVLGVLGASVLESYLLNPSPLLFFGVGLIEEAVKLAALMYLTRSLVRRSPRDGIVLGAAVGFGFAAFETAGYAFNALLTVKGLSLINLVETELIRGLLAPLGHGLWTAVLGGFLFMRPRGSGFFRSLPLILMYLWVSLLHALWDSSGMIAVVITFLLTGTDYQQRMLEYGYFPQPTQKQIHLFTAMTHLLLTTVGALGILTLAYTWVRARTRAPA